MAFGQPFRPAGAPAQPAAPAAPAAPAYGQPPAPPAAPAFTPPAPPAPVAEAQFWAAVNGATVPVSASQLASLPPGTQVMPQDQSRPWAPKESYAPTTAHPAAPAPAQGFGARQAPAAGGAQVGVPRGAFAGVENAEVYQRNPNLNPGKYVFELGEAEYKQLRAGGAAVILEGRILVSTYDPNQPHTHQCNKEGTSASIFVKQNDNFASNMKEIVLALSGFDAQGNPRPLDSVVTSQECEALVSAEQAYKGVKVYLEASEITTKQQKPFTRVNWHPCPVDATGAPDMAKLSQLYGA